jgi:hypothetical protein
VIGDPHDSKGWTGDTAGRARTEAPLFTLEVKSEIGNVLKWTSAVVGVVLIMATLSKVVF